jgi:hypothetical protein
MLGWFSGTHDVLWAYEVHPSFPKVNLAIGIGHGLFDWSKVTNVIAKRCLMGETDVLLSTSSHIFSAEACSRPPYLQKPLDRQTLRSCSPGKAPHAV